MQKHSTAGYLGEVIVLNWAKLASRNKFTLVAVPKEKST